MVHEPCCLNAYVAPRPSRVPWIAAAWVIHATLCGRLASPGHASRCITAGDRGRWVFPPLTNFIVQQLEAQPCNGIVRTQPDRPDWFASKGAIKQPMSASGSLIIPA